MGNKPVKLGNNNAPPFGQSKLANKGTRVQIRELNTVLNDQNPSNKEPMSKIDKRKSIVLEEPPKQGKEWQVVRQSGKSGTKNSKGVKITLEESKDVVDQMKDWGRVSSSDCPALKCTRLERKDLWTYLRSLSSDMEGPWLAGGDFNSIFSRYERLYGATLHHVSIEDFANTLLDCGLLDAGFEGNSFTWTNDHMLQRLDRVLYNREWAELFSSTKVQHLARDRSDHYPLLINYSMTSQRGPLAFYFLYAWTKHHTFMSFVERLWKFPIQTKGLKAFWYK
ncbi:Retrotransposon, unclassified-like protein [Theobroma cacao]|uniref:Retrotransposon, unclassified-like protein n=1 Tax=Theobroma cacao TaxID=3641 RepID=S1SN02_THECC|nr:Retrotransposon, unclassified-like protein [Theobroma cacao]